MAEEVIKSIESTPALVEQLERVFDELESQRESSHNRIRREEIKEYFYSLERSLKRKFDELEEKDMAYKQKQSETKLLLAERKASVAAKEQESLDRLQQLKDIAVSAVVEARKKCKVTCPVPEDLKGINDKKVISSVTDDPNAFVPASEENKPDHKSGVVAEPMTVEVNLRPQLRQFCEQMDAKGLLKFISGNKKTRLLLCEELSVALKSATDPARLVLDSLEDFYPPEQSNSQGKEDTAHQGLRRTCLYLMESVVPILESSEPSGECHVSSEVKLRAKAIADEWKLKLAGVNIDACNGYLLEAHAFLQLLVTFSIVSEFDEDELCKLVLAVSRRWQAPELCRSLGLSNKMPGIIEALIKTGKQINAVHFAHAFQLVENFPPVPLLKQYLEDLKSSAQESGGSNVTDGVHNEASAQEMSALKAVIKCIEDYKLQDQLPPEPLQTRLSQLAKAKNEKKPSAEASKSQAKRHRANGRYSGKRPGSSFNNRKVTPRVFNDKGAYAGATYPERYPHTAPHSYTAQPLYEVPSRASYGQTANVQMAYHYQNERVPPAAPYGAPANYGSHMGPGLQPYSNNYGNYAASYGSHPSTGVPPAHQPYM